MSEGPTTKYVTVTVKLVFYGNCIDVEDIPARSAGWIRSALDDRDDLQEILIEFGPVAEVDGDPEGYDS